MTAKCAHVTVLQGRDDVHLGPADDLSKRATQNEIVTGKKYKYVAKFVVDHAAVSAAFCKVAVCVHTQSHP